jgi:hypothetical protein
MDTVTIVVVGIWNGLLVGAVGAVIVWRERLLEWVTGADLDGRYEWDVSGDDQWLPSWQSIRNSVSGSQPLTTRNPSGERLTAPG